MKPRAAIPLLLLSALALHAQLRSTLNASPDGPTEIRLRNDASSTVAAFAIRVDYVNRITTTPQVLTVYVDPQIDAILPSRAGVRPVAISPILPQQEIRFSPEVLVAISALSGKPAFSNLSVAGIFEDGGTTGDPALLTRLLMRRGNLLSAVETALDLLADAGRRNVPRNQLIDRFTQMAASVSRPYLPDEQQIGRTLYQSVIQELRNLPQPNTGSPFPPNEFVMRETTQLTRHRAALLQSRPALAAAFDR
ncbi:MAG: hypothetical protein WDO18_22065 [Acidobacteriota bacterium]